MSATMSGSASTPAKGSCSFATQGDWLGDDLAGSLRLYKENRRRPLTFKTGERVEPPLGVSVFPREIAMPPRSWIEHVFDVRRWTDMPARGHFAALEKPDLLAAELRAFFRPLR